MMARSAKMIQYLMFMDNESTEQVADLQARETAPNHAEIRERIGARLAEQNQLRSRRRSAAMRV
jgi:hypothetical protein